MNTGALTRGPAAVFVWLLNALLLTFFGVSPTAAVLASSRGPQSWQPQAVLVAEFSAYYEWAAGSTLAADGYRVIAPTGGAAGRWIMAGPALYLTPSGGDDAARVVAAANSMGAKGRVVLLGGHGNFRVESLHQLTSGAWIEGANPDVAVVTDMPAVVGNTTFSALAASTGAQSALSADVAVGASSFTTTIAVAGAVVGSVVGLGDIAGLSVQQYTVTNIAGTVYTVERPIWQPYEAVTAVAFLVLGAPTVTIRNLLLVGISGDRAVELSFGRDCLLQALRVVSLAAGVALTLPDGTVVTGTGGYTGNIVASDTASLRTRIDAVYVDAGGVGNIGVAVESNELTTVSASGAADCGGGTAAALYVNASVSCVVVGFAGSGSTIGALLDGGVSVSSVFCQVQASVFTKNATAVYLFDVASGWTLDCVEASYGGLGVVVDKSGATAPSGNRITNLRAHGNASHGVHLVNCTGTVLTGDLSRNGDDALVIAASATGTQVPWLTGGGNAGFQVNAAAPLLLGPVYALENTENVIATTGGGIFVSGGADVTVAALYATASWNGGNWHAAEVAGAGSRLRVCAGLISTAGTGAKLAFQSDTGASTVLALSNCKATGGNLVGLYANPGTIRQGPNVDVSECGLATTLGAGQFSQGTKVLTGAAPTTYAFADIKAEDTVSVRTTALGVTSALYSAAISPGVGVVLTGESALALDTVQVSIGG